jgi:hypothetical protein
MKEKYDEEKEKKKERKKKEGKHSIMMLIGVRLDEIVRPLTPDLVGKRGEGKRRIERERKRVYERIIP